MNLADKSGLVELAAALSKKWHEGQVDIAGAEYWTHPARVATNVQSIPGFGSLSADEQSDVVCAAYLHDVVEDCGVRASDLMEAGFSQNTVDAVLLLSKNHDYSHIEAYCERIRGNAVARMVKLADLSDNCNLQRQEVLRAQGYVIDEAKYPRVRALLETSAAEEEWFARVIQVEVVA